MATLVASLGQAGLSAGLGLGVCVCVCVCVRETHTESKRDREASRQVARQPTEAALPSLGPMSPPLSGVLLVAALLWVAG